MKKFTVIFLIITSVIIFSYTTIDRVEAQYTVSKGEAVIDVDSGRVLYSYNENEKLPMASTTKIITAITVIENADINKVIEVTSKTTGTEGSSVYLKVGDRFTIKDLLYGLMLRSGNDCAETLAVAVSGDIESFCELMRCTAEKCGAGNSSFKNPHGLPAAEHYTTALDLCRITAYALKNPIFSEIVSTKVYTAEELTHGEKRVWHNKNKLLFRFDGADGVKTGYTKEAGRCFVGSATKNGMRIVAAVLDSPQMFERSEELLTEAFNKYKTIKIVDSDRFDYVLLSPEKDKSYKLRIKDSFSYPVSTEDKIKVIQELPDNLSGNVKNGQIVGKIKIYCSKQLIFSQDIYTLI